MVITADEVKPLMTGYEMKSTRNPSSTPQREHTKTHVFPANRPKRPDQG
jgi:hypothetical protein